MARKRRKKQRPMPAGTTIRWYEDDQALWEWLAPFAKTHDMTQVIKLALYRLSGIEPNSESFAALMERVEGHQVQSVAPDPADLLDLVDAIREAVREEMAEARREGDEDDHRGGGGSGSGGVIRDDIRFGEERDEAGGVAASGANPTLTSPVPSSRLTRRVVGGTGSATPPTSMTDGVESSSGIDMVRRRSRPRPKMIKQPPTLPEIPPVDEDIDLAALGKLMARSIKQPERRT